jgi:hypothetical protein
LLRFCVDLICLENCSPKYKIIILKNYP